MEYVVLYYNDGNGAWKDSQGKQGVESRDPSPVWLGKALNEYAAEGWQLTAATHDSSGYTLFFKRQD